MYEGYQIYGPYTSKKDGRSRVVLVHKTTKKKTTLSYPKYLLELKLGRYLKSNEQAHHRDEDFTNNVDSNLELLVLGEHQKLHNPKLHVATEEICVECGTLFIMSSEHHRNRATASGKATKGPHCSRRCAGIYSKRVQMQPNWERGGIGRHKGFKIPCRKA